MFCYESSASSGPWGACSRIAEVYGGLTSIGAIDRIACRTWKAQGQFRSCLDGKE